MISKTRQNELAIHWLEHHDDPSMLEIIESFEGMIAKFTSKTRRFSGIPDQDLRHIAILGVIAGVNKFDPAKGDLSAIVFSTIRERVMEESTKNATLLSIPNSRTEKIGRTKGHRAYKDAISRGATHYEAVKAASVATGVDMQRIELIVSTGTTTITRSRTGESGDQDIDVFDSWGLGTPFTTDEDMSRSQSYDAYMKTVADVLKKETERNRECFLAKLYRDPPATAHDLAKQYGVSPAAINMGIKDTTMKIRALLKKRGISLVDLE